MAVNKKIIGLLIVVMLFGISGITNILLYHHAIDILQELMKVKIDPTSSLQYPDINKNTVKEKGRLFTVVLFGDSRIYQWKNFPHLPGWKVLNRGVPGDTTAMSLLRIERDIVSLKPAMVVIELGINDCNSIGVMPELNNFITSNCKKNIKRIIDILNHNRIRTVFLTIFPVSTVYPYRWPIWSDATRDAVEEINSFIMQCKGSYVQVLNCDEIFLQSRKMKSDYAENMLHLNRGGYEALNAFIKPHLMKMADKFAVKE